MTERLPWHQEPWERLQRSRQHNRLPHALLLAGVEGLGKLAFARRLARSMLCEQPDEHGDACGHCRQCLLLQAENHPDLRVVTPDEDSSVIRIDAIRDLVSGNTLSVGENSHRVFIIEPAHAMGQGAANALLKTLEEPIPGTLMLLVTSSPDRLPVTIRSRCQLLRFSPPEENLALAWLQESGLSPGDAREALKLSAGAPLLSRELVADGTLRQHQALREDFLSLARGQASPVAVAEAWLKQKELEALLVFLSSWIMEAIRGKLMQGKGKGASPLQSRHEWVDLKELYRLLDSLNDTRRASANNLNAQLALESILLEWSRITRG